MPNHSRIISKTLDSSPWTQENESAILAPYTYLTSAPSKETLRHLANALNDWLKVESTQLELIIKIAQALQNDSLLFDDIEDGSELRRGQPVANSVYGVPQTVNAASYIVIMVYKDALELHAIMNKTDLIPGSTPVEIITGILWTPRRILSYLMTFLMVEELLNAHRGQGMDILWRDHVRCPSEDEYIDMIKNKTASLFRILMRLMMACATERKDVNFIPLIDLIGVMYQIRDDYSNLRDASYSDTKGFAEDLTEGKFSFPLVHAIRADESNTQLLDIIRQRPKSPALKGQALSYMETETQSFDYTLAVLRALQGRIAEEMETLGGNPMLEKLLNKLRVK
ncbi:isoprenoid synthase domain-containing protein [Lentinula boryana]|uniref:(2E,6E)-farnesyl diphosphate synthase n=1 Tax=Lentinula boryana TaxID=40481 RepID=A0ABQ8QNX9_9AGAR|nr:isoprenoid synthase domain-containing protein [Lentinula boryana]